MSSLRSVIPNPTNYFLGIPVQPSRYGTPFPRRPRSIRSREPSGKMAGFFTPAVKARGILGLVVWPALGRPLR